MVTMKCSGQEGQVLLLPKTGGSSKENMLPSQCLADSVRTLFQTIVKEHGGGIFLDNLIAEYEMKAGRKLNLNELGFNSIPDLLSNFADIFQVIKNGDKHFVCDSVVKHFGDSQSKEVSPVNGTRRKLSQECIARLKKLFEEEFPDGLSTDELIGAYRGFYGAVLDDLNPEIYGYRTLEALLKCHPEVANIQYRDGKFIVLANTSLFPHISDQVEPLSWPLNVADVHDSYQKLDEKLVLVVGQMVDFLVGEVYSPSRFWVIHKGRDTSEALNSLMDCMFEFYGSCLGERYVVPEEKVTIRAPVIALHEEDMNFYRAFIMSLEDLRTVKLFFVDYGTVCQCDYSCLRLVHKNFFTLPAQAMKAALSGVIPSHGRRSWGRESSQRFLELVQNKAVVGHIVSLKGSAYMNLWDTNNQEDINIGEILVAEGWASPIHPAPLDVLGQPDSSAVKTSYSSPEKLIIQCIDPVVTNISSPEKQIIQCTDPVVTNISSPEKQIIQCTDPVVTNISSPEENSSTSINSTPVVSFSDAFTQFPQSDPHGSHVAGVDLIHDKYKNLPSCTSLNLSHIALDSKQNVENKSPTVTPYSAYETTAFIENLCNLMNALNLKSSGPGAWGPSLTPFSCTATPTSPPPLSTREASQKISLSHKLVPQCYQKPIQELEVMSDTSTRVTEARKLSTLPPPPGFGPVPANLQVTLPLPDVGLPSINYEVIEPTVGVRSVPDNNQAVSSMGLQTNVTRSLDPPILSTGIDDIFYSDDEEEEVIIKNLKSRLSHQMYQCVIKRVALTASVTLHVIELNEKSFVLSAEVSQLLNLDVHSLLQEKNMDFPSVVLEKDCHANVYLQLIEHGCKAVYGGDREILPSLIIYPMTILQQIPQFVSCDKSNLLPALKNLVDEYTGQDPGCFERGTQEARCLITGTRDTIPSIPSHELRSQTDNTQDPSDSDNKLKNSSEELLEHLDEYLDISDTPDYDPSNSKGFGKHCKKAAAVVPQNKMLRKPVLAANNYCSDSSSSSECDEYDPSISKFLNYSKDGVETLKKTPKVQESKTLDKFPKETKLKIEPHIISEVPNRNTSPSVVKHVVTPTQSQKNLSVRPKEIKIYHNIKKETVKLPSRDCLRNQGECNNNGKISLISSQHARESAQLTRNEAISIPSKIFEIKVVVPEESALQCMNVKDDTFYKPNKCITQNKENTIHEYKGTTHEYKVNTKQTKIQNEISKVKELVKCSSNLEDAHCVGRENLSASQSCSSKKASTDSSNYLSVECDVMKNIVLYQRKLVSYLRKNNLANKNHKLFCDIIDNTGKCLKLYEIMLKSKPLNVKLQKCSDAQKCLKSDMCISECDQVFYADVDSDDELYKKSEDVDSLKNNKVKDERWIKNRGFNSHKIKKDGEHMKSAHYSLNAMKCASVNKDHSPTGEAYDMKRNIISTENQNNLQSTSSYITTWVNNTVIGCTLMPSPVYPQIVGYAQLIETHPLNAVSPLIPVQNSRPSYFASSLQRN